MFRFYFPLETVNISVRLSFQQKYILKFNVSVVFKDFFCLNRLTDQKRMSQ